MLIEGYGEFPFEIGDTIREKAGYLDQLGDTAKITDAQYNYVWYEMLTGEDKGATYCTRTERFEDEWELVKQLGQESPFIGGH